MTTLHWIKWSDNDVKVTSGDDPTIKYTSSWSSIRPLCLRVEPPTTPLILTTSYDLVLTEDVHEQIKDLNFTTLIVKTRSGIRPEEVNTIIKIAMSGQKVGIMREHCPLGASVDMDIFQFHEYLLSIVIQ